MRFAFLRWRTAWYEVSKQFVSLQKSQTLPPSEVNKVNTRNSMLHEPFENQFSISVWVKIVLCVWIGTIILLYVILFWPSSLWELARELGISGILQNLQAWITPFFTAGYLSWTIANGNRIIWYCLLKLFFSCWHIQPPAWEGEFWRCAFWHTALMPL